jgi:hypothetical protein
MSAILTTSCKQTDRLALKLVDMTYQLAVVGRIAEPSTLTLRVMATARRVPHGGFPSLPVSALAEPLSHLTRATAMISLVQLGRVANEGKSIVSRHDFRVGRVRGASGAGDAGGRQAVARRVRRDLRPGDRGQGDRFGRSGRRRLQGHLAHQPRSGGRPLASRSVSDGRLRL